MRIGHVSACTWHALQAEHCRGTGDVPALLHCVLMKYPCWQAEHFRHLWVSVVPPPPHAVLGSTYFPMGHEEHLEHTRSSGDFAVPSLQAPDEMYSPAPHGVQAAQSLTLSTPLLHTARMYCPGAHCCVHGRHLLTSLNVDPLHLSAR